MIDDIKYISDRDVFFNINFNIFGPILVRWVRCGLLCSGQVCFISVQRMNNICTKILLDIMSYCILV